MILETDRGRGAPAKGEGAPDHLRERRRPVHDELRGARAAAEYGPGVPAHPARADTKDWRSRPITSLTKQDVLDVLSRIEQRGAPAAANRALAYLSKFFNWCVEQDLIAASPTTASGHFRGTARATGS